MGDAEPDDDGTDDGTEGGYLDLILDTWSWECVVDDDCNDGDHCTIDRCDEDHLCIFERMTGLALLGDPVLVSEKPWYSHLGAMTWTDSALAMAFEDGRTNGCSDAAGPVYCNNEVHMKLVSLEGVDICPATRITDASEQEHVESIIWTGSEIWIGWYGEDIVSSEHSVKATRVDRSCRDVGDDLLVTTGEAGMCVDLAWANSEIAALLQKSLGYTWPADRGADLHYVTLGTDGEETRDVILETSDGYARWGCGSLAWSGSIFGAVWYDFEPDTTVGSGLSFNILDENGTYLVEESIPWQSEVAKYPRIVWTGSEFLAFWATLFDDESLSSQVHLQRFDEAGHLVGETRQMHSTIPESHVSGLVWTGSELGLTWWDSTGSGPEGYFLATTADGEPLDDPLPVPGPAHLVWTGSEYVIGWSDETTGNYEIYIQKVGYCE